MWYPDPNVTWVARLGATDAGEAVLSRLVVKQLRFGYDEGLNTLYDEAWWLLAVALPHLTPTPAWHAPPLCVVGISQHAILSTIGAQFHAVGSKHQRAPSQNEPNPPSN